MIRPPTHCRSGHRLPRQCLVGFAPARDSSRLLLSVLPAEQLHGGDDSPGLAVFDEAVSDAIVTAQRLAMRLGAPHLASGAFVAWRYLRPKKRFPSQSTQTISTGPAKKIASYLLDSDYRNTRVEPRRSRVGAVRLLSVSLDDDHGVCCRQ